MQEIKNKDLLSLIRVAEKYGETPLEFFDHLIVVYESNLSTPLMEKSRKEGVSYDSSKDPYHNAYNYMVDAQVSGDASFGKIINLKRSLILEELKEKGKGKVVTIDFNSELISATKKVIEEKRKNSNGFKRIHINTEYFNILGNKYDGEDYNSKLIEMEQNARVLFRNAIKGNLIKTSRKEIVEYIKNDISLIRSMRFNKKLKITTIWVNQETWDCVVSLYSPFLKGLLEEEIMRGIFFYLFNAVVTTTIKDNKNK